MKVPSGQDLLFFGFMIFFLVMNTAILVWCARGFKSKMLWAAVPHISWHIANAQVLATLFLKKNEVTPRDSLGWVLLLDYFIYVTLPIRLRYCIILSVGTCASYIAAIIGLSKSDLHFYQQNKKGGLVLRNIKAATWITGDFYEHPVIWNGQCNPNQESYPMQLLEYSSDAKLLKLITDYSNGYAQRQNVDAVADVTTYEVKHFIGVLLFNGYVDLPEIDLMHIIH
ncbi:hypothetical protein JTB14_026371 [Gonioctena quinquepunctata]|nr:hypothetical protein JTB14_026371 [Gonioctena quinquepunctata]